VIRDYLRKKWNEDDYSEVPVFGLSEIHLTHVRSGILNSIPLNGIIDTGASNTIIPLSTFLGTKAEPDVAESGRDFTSERHELVGFIVNFRVPSLCDIKKLTVYAARRDDILIGRDVLQAMRAILYVNWASQRFTLVKQPPERHFFKFLEAIKRI
jgi:hypothetical protein